MTMKKVFKVIGAVFLLFVLAVMGYVFTPFLALLVVSMESVTVVLMQVVILLLILVVIKTLWKTLSGSTTPILSIRRTISNFLKKKKSKTVETVTEPD